MFLFKVYCRPYVSGTSKMYVQQIFNDTCCQGMIKCDAINSHWSMPYQANCHILYFDGRIGHVEPSGFLYWRKRIDANVTPRPHSRQVTATDITVL